MIEVEGINLNFKIESVFIEVYEERYHVEVNMDRLFIHGSLVGCVLICWGMKICVLEYVALIRLYQFSIRIRLNYHFYRSMRLRFVDILYAWVVLSLYQIIIKSALANLTCLSRYDNEDIGMRSLSKGK